MNERVKTRTRMPSRLLLGDLGQCVKQREDLIEAGAQLHAEIADRAHGPCRR